MKCIVLISVFWKIINNCWAAGNSVTQYSTETCLESPFHYPEIIQHINSFVENDNSAFIQTNKKINTTLKQYYTVYAKQNEKEIINIYSYLSAIYPYERDFVINKNLKANLAYERFWFISQLKKILEKFFLLLNERNETFHDLYCFSQNAYSVINNYCLSKIQNPWFEIDLSGSNDFFKNRDFYRKSQKALSRFKALQKYKIFKDEFNFLILKEILFFYQNIGKRLNIFVGDFSDYSRSIQRQVDIFNKDPQFAENVKEFIAEQELLTGKILSWNKDAEFIKTFEQELSQTVDKKFFGDLVNFKCYNMKQSSDFIEYCKSARKTWSSALVQKIEEFQTLENAVSFYKKINKTWEKVGLPNILNRIEAYLHNRDRIVCILRQKQKAFQEKVNAFCGLRLQLDNLNEALRKHYISLLLVRSEEIKRRNSDKILIKIETAIADILVLEKEIQEIEVCIPYTNIQIQEIAKKGEYSQNIYQLIQILDNSSLSEKAQNLCKYWDVSGRIHLDSLAALDTYRRNVRFSNSKLKALKKFAQGFKRVFDCF